MSGMQFDGLDQMQSRLDQYQAIIQYAIRTIADYFAPLIETYAKTNASWTDRTGNARQSLYTTVIELSKDVVAIYLSHGMDYGKWLELRWSGKYAIIMPALEAHYGLVYQMIKEVFNG